MTKPTIDPNWADDAGALKTDPGASKRSDGWVIEKPSVFHMNFILNLFGQWILWLTGSTTPNIYLRDWLLSNPGEGELGLVSRRVQIGSVEATSLGGSGTGLFDVVSDGQFLAASDDNGNITLLDQGDHDNPSSFSIGPAASLNRLAADANGIAYWGRVGTTVAGSVEMSGGAATLSFTFSSNIVDICTDGFHLYAALSNGNVEAMVISTQVQAWLYVGLNGEALNEINTDGITVAVCCDQTAAFVCAQVLSANSGAIHVVDASGATASYTFNVNPVLPATADGKSICYSPSGAIYLGIRDSALPVRTYLFRLVLFVPATGVGSQKVWINGPDTVAGGYLFTGFKAICADGVYLYVISADTTAGDSVLRAFTEIPEPVFTTITAGPYAQLREAWSFRTTSVTDGFNSVACDGDQVHVALTQSGVFDRVISFKAHRSEVRFRRRAVDAPASGPSAPMTGKTSIMRGF